MSKVEQMRQFIEQVKQSEDAIRRLCNLINYSHGNFSLTPEHSFFKYLSDNEEVFKDFKELIKYLVSFVSGHADFSKMELTGQADEEGAWVRLKISKDYADTELTKSVTWSEGDISRLLEVFKVFETDLKAYNSY